MDTDKDASALGLVLSGGGVRGVAHIGVLKAMEEHGLQATHIAGASSGALVGALYAAGHGWESVLEFFRHVSLFSWGKFARHKAGMFDADKYHADLAPFFTGDDFATLQKQLFVVASDLVKGRSKVFHEGPLIRTLLASSAVPGVFSPVQIEDTLYADGGITNNFPTEPLLAHCDHIIGVFVNPLKQITAGELSSSFAVMERAYSMDRASSSIRKFDDCDVVIHPEALAAFGTFSTSHVDEIFRIGYEAALRKLEEYEARAAVRKT
ncbi:MAG: patatin-like phospholipase family protein [Bacteroidetes bacterium]|nr:patatin-like phospholipase family protein [Bacteroidota bacterium]MBS1940071.1 patatin-like phospholipase family protein [Bacteroidota bacterium]